MPWIAPIAGAVISAVAAHNQAKPGQAGPASSGGVNQDQINNGIYRTQTGLDQQQNMVNMLQGQSAIANQSNVFGQQQALANQFQAQANGQGPNPAMAQLANATGQNIAAQGSLMAGQRGAGANAGLMARQIAQQGGALQQQAVGQGAVMQANQQLAAQQALQAQQGLMANMTGQQVGQLQNANQQYNAATQNYQNSLLNANAGQASNQNAVNLQNAAAQQQVNLQNQKVIGGAINSAGPALGLFNKPDNEKLDVGPGEQAPASYQMPAARDGWQTAAHGGLIHPSGCSSKAGQYLHEMKHGGKVAGKAKMPGDNSKNDTVPTMLSPGEIVIPRSIAEHPDAPAKAAKFVAALMRKKGK